MAVDFLSPRADTPNLGPDPQTYPKSHDDECFRLLSFRGRIKIKRTRLDGYRLNQSQSGIYIDTGLGSPANTVFPANAGIQGTVRNVLSRTPAYASVTKGLAPTGFTN